MEMIHDARIIPLDGRSHVSPAIQQWHGDSRGHWEGDPLVVDTTDLSSKSNFRGASDYLHVTEGFAPVSEGTIEYSITVDDRSRLTTPTTWTSPWTAMIPLRRTDEPCSITRAMRETSGWPRV